jgi:hypothetical protein
MCTLVPCGVLTLWTPSLCVSPVCIHTYTPCVSPVCIHTYTPCVSPVRIHTHIHTVCKPCVFTHSVFTLGVCKPCVFTHCVFTLSAKSHCTQRAFVVSGASCFGALCKHVFLPDVVLRSWCGYLTGWAFDTHGLGFRV